MFLDKLGAGHFVVDIVLLLMVIYFQFESLYKFVILNHIKSASDN